MALKQQVLLNKRRAHGCRGASRGKLGHGKAAPRFHEGGQVELEWPRETRFGEVPWRVQRAGSEDISAHRRHRLQVACQRPVFREKGPALGHQEPAANSIARAEARAEIGACVAAVVIRPKQQPVHATPRQSRLTRNGARRPAHAGVPHAGGCPRNSTRLPAQVVRRANESDRGSRVWPATPDRDLKVERGALPGHGPVGKDSSAVAEAGAASVSNTESVAVQASER